MTNLDALIAEVEPYTVSPFAYKKHLIDSGISEVAEYTAENKKPIAICAIRILIALLPLSSDSTGHSSQGYNKQGLEERIKRLCADNGLKSEDFLEEPTVTYYPNLF